MGMRDNSTEIPYPGYIEVLHCITLQRLVAISSTHNMGSVQFIMTSLNKLNKAVQNFSKGTNFEVLSQKISFFTPNNGLIRFLSNHGVMYQQSCPGCKKFYIGKNR